MGVQAFTSTFEEGGLRGIYLIKSPLTPLFQRGGLNAYMGVALFNLEQSFVE